MGRTQNSPHPAGVGPKRIRALVAAYLQLRSFLLLVVVFSTALVTACGPPPQAPQPADPEALIEVPLTVHVATERGAPVVSDAQILATLKRTNVALAPYNMRVRVERVRTMSAGHTVVDGEPDRLELARRADRDGTLHVFFVNKVRMEIEDDADARLSGLHWRYVGMRTQMHEREFVVVAEDAPTTTLAHEVGHAFGLEHHKSFENIMCSCRRGPDTLFTPRQGEQIRSGAVTFMGRRLH